MVDFGLGNEIIHGAVGHGAGAFNGGSLREFELHSEVALVFLWHEALGYQAVHYVDGHQYQAESGKHAA